MTKQKFPKGWNEKKVKELIAYYDSLTEDEWLAEDEAAREESEETLMMVPTDLVPAVRKLIARRKVLPKALDRTGPDGVVHAL